MDDILHMRKDESAKTNGAPERQEMDRASKVLVFIWRKMQDQQKNLSHTFKIFDTKDKGKLKRADFLAGLERFTISLSEEDQEAAWIALDSKKKGYLTFEDFSKIH